MAVDFYAQQRKNVTKTAVLVVSLTAVVFVAGIGLDIAFGTGFMITAVLLAVVLIEMLVAFGGGAAIVLKSVNAHEIPENTKDLEEKQLLNIVDELTIPSDLPRPKVYVMEDLSINAFATGSKKEKSYVCVTRGLLQNLNRAETEGVIAHEFSHIKNRDILLMTTVSALVGGVLLLAILAFRFGWLFLRVSPFSGGGRRGGGKKGNGGNVVLAIALAMLATAAVMFIVGQISRLMTLAISRKREFLADATAVEFTRNPDGLSSALKKIYKMAIPTSSANSALSHLFISAPKRRKYSEKRGWFANLMSTHPPLIDRIAVLESRDPQQVYDELNPGFN